MPRRFLGGVGVGKSSPTFDLGIIGNIISGLIGGGVLGQIVTLLLPAITAAAQSGDLSIGGIISQAIAGGAGGAAILTAIDLARGAGDGHGFPPSCRT